MKCYYHMAIKQNPGVASLWSFFVAVTQVAMLSQTTILNFACQKDK